MADPEKVGIGLAKHIQGKSFMICHSFGQRVQMSVRYLFSVRMGKLMSKMTARYDAGKDKSFLNRAEGRNRFLP